MRSFDVFVDLAPSGQWRYKASDGNVSVWSGPYERMDTKDDAVAGARRCIESVWRRYRFDMRVNARGNTRYL